jgi:nucleotide-binding universal stress UspA family protein
MIGTRVRQIADVVADVPRFATAPLFRRRHQRWGATPAELTASMPGDRLLVVSPYRCTRAITIRAEPARVWPWLVQVGCRRGGFYSDDLLDNLGRPSADRIRPELQKLYRGQLVPMASHPSRDTAFVVSGYEKPRWLLWTKADSTWSWVLTADREGGTRLVTRIKARYDWSRPGVALLGIVLMEFGDFAMMRRMLLGIQRRAEYAAGAEAGVPRHRDVRPWVPPALSRTMEWSPPEPGRQPRAADERRPHRLIRRGSLVAPAGGRSPPAAVRTRGSDMGYVDRAAAQEEARRAAARAGHSTRYGEAVNRYLRAESAVDEPLSAVRTAPRVVVAVDGTPASYLAADHAAIEAELRGWSLHLVHVQSNHDHGARLLEHMTARVQAGARGVPVSSRLIAGPVVGGVLDNVHPDDLVVVGHRHGPVETGLGLAAGERIAARHTGPAFVVRVPGWPPGAEFVSRPIVAGVDEDTGSPLVVAFALAEARLRGCHVVLLTGWTNPIRSPDRIEEMDGLTVHHRSSATDPATALTIASRNAAAIVVGRGRHRSGEGGLGSIGRALVQHADCPVFLVG